MRSVLARKCELLANIAIELGVYERNPKVYIRLCNLPLVNGQQTNLCQLDVLHHPKSAM